jgi:hypothetical protein
MNGNEQIEAPRDIVATRKPQRPSSIRDGILKLRNHGGALPELIAALHGHIGQSG